MAADSTPEEEVRRLERHYSVNPEGLVFARLADAYRRSGRLERSLALLREGLERHPDYTTGHLIEGRTLREAGRPDEAAASFRRVLDLDAGNLVALRSLAELAAERGDMDEAHRWTDRLEQADPFTSFDPARAAAGAREKREQDTEGEEENGAGDAAGTEGRGGESAELRDTAGGSEPPFADGASTELPGEEGLASEIAAMADEQWWSSTDADAAGAVDPAEGSGDLDDSDVATETMAHLYAQQGLYEEAADVYRRLLERRPDDPELQGRLEEMTRRAGGGNGDEEERGETAEDPSPDAGPADATGSREPERSPSSGEVGADRDRGRDVSAGEHFRALLRGRARPPGSDDGDGDASRATDGAGAGDPPEADGGVAG